MSRRMLYEITMKAYSFDWDDNILHMPTMVNMEKKEGDKWVPIKLTTGEYADLKDNEDYRYPDNNMRAAFTDFDNDELVYCNGSLLNLQKPKLVESKLSQEEQEKYCMDCGLCCFHDKELVKTKNKFNIISKIFDDIWREEKSSCKYLEII